MTAAALEQIERAGLDADASLAIRVRLARALDITLDDLERVTSARPHPPPGASAV